jgi:mercuric ion binding protein
MIKFFVLAFILCTSAYAKETQVKISGMVCTMCAQGIQKKFSKLPEVKNIKVDMDTKIVSIETHEGKELSDAKIEEIIKDAGYNVAK